MIKKNGSALLLTIMIGTFLSMLVLGFWYKTSLLMDIALQKEVYYKNFYLTESFLNYGIKIVKKNWDIMLDKKFLIKYPIKLTKNFESKIDSSIENVSVKVIFNRIAFNNIYKNEIYILSVLKKGPRIIFNLSCKLVKKDEDSEEPQFVVQNFTVHNNV